MKIITTFAIICCVAVLGLSRLAGEDKKAQEQPKKSARDILLGKDMEAVGRLQMDLPQERRETIKDLIFVLEKLPLEDGFLDGRAEAAVYLLGELRADEPEAIRVLANKIDEFPFVRDGLSIGTPCFRALKRIGKPASLECLKRLATADGKKPKDRNIGRRELLLMVVRDVEGEEVAKFMLERAIAKEQDKKHKENLTAALDLLEKWKKDREEHEKKWREKNKADTPAPSEPSEKPEE